MSDFPLPIDPAVLAPGLLAWMQAGDVMVSLKEAGSGRYLWANPAMLEFIGTDAAGLVQRTDLELLPQSDAVAVRAADQRALESGAEAQDTHRFERGGARVELQAWRCVLEKPSVPAQMLTIWRPSAQQLLEQRLEKALAQIERQQAALSRLLQDQSRNDDRPTALFRREHFEEQLRREAALSQREGREFALVLLAVDRMELLQQRGAQAAAQVCETVNRLMRSNTRAMDVLSQLGPDRFAILFSGIGLATAHSRVEQLRRACASELLVIDGESFGFEISAGVASFPHTADSLAALSQAAIRALNDARQRGGNRVALASIQMSGLTER